MTNNNFNETMVEQKVTYTLQLDDKLIIIENVPARVCLESGEKFFSPDTVEKLQETIWENKKPRRIIETPVYEFVKVKLDSYTNIGVDMKKGWEVKRLGDVLLKTKRLTQLKSLMKSLLILMLQVLIKKQKKLKMQSC